MRSAVTILAGLATGILLAIGILAALVFLGPDPVGIRPTPPPSVVPEASASPSPSALPSASVDASGSLSPSASPSPSPSGSSAPSAAPSGSDASQTGFQVGEPAPALAIAQLGGETIDLPSLAVDTNADRPPGRA
jgi:cytoskeletal protein RodZ